jgi:hypothetical protein
MKSCGPISQVNTVKARRHRAGRAAAKSSAASNGRWGLRELLNCTANSDSLAHSCDRWQKFSCGKKLGNIDEHKIEFKMIKFNFMFIYREAITNLSTLNTYGQG